MITQTLEGVWEDVAKRSDELKGRRVRVTVFADEDSPKPNRAALRVISRVAEQQAEMPFTSATETLQILREGRDGAMFGYDADK